MAYNQTGIEISIKAFLPIGKTLDEQLEALTLVKTSHETGDYAALLAAAGIDGVKTVQKTRRIEDEEPQQAQEVIQPDTANEPDCDPENDPDFAEIDGMEDDQELADTPPADLYDEEPATSKRKRK